MVAFASRYKFGLLVAAVGAIALYAFSRYYAATQQRYSNLSKQIGSLQETNKELQRNLKTANSNYDLVSKQYGELASSKTDLLTSRMEKLRELILGLDSTPEKLEKLKKKQELKSKELEQLPERELAVEQMITQLKWMASFGFMKGDVREIAVGALAEMEGILEDGIPDEKELSKKIEADLKILQDIIEDVDFEHLIDEKENKNKSSDTSEVEDLKRRKQLVDQLKADCQIPPNVSKEEIKKWAVEVAEGQKQILEQGLPKGGLDGIFSALGKRPEDLKMELVILRDVVNSTDFKALKKELEVELGTIEESIAGLEKAPKELEKAKIDLEILEKGFNLLQKPLEAEELQTKKEVPNRSGNVSMTQQSPEMADLD